VTGNIVILSKALGNVLFQTVSFLSYISVFHNTNPAVLRNMTFLTCVDISTIEFFFYYEL